MVGPIFLFKLCAPGPTGWGPIRHQGMIIGRLHIFLRYMRALGIYVGIYVGIYHIHVGIMYSIYYIYGYVLCDKFI